MNGKSMDVVTRVTKAIQNTAKPKGRRGVPALMGNAAGVVATGNAGIVYVRTFEGQVIEILNRHAPNVPDHPVLIGEDESQPGVLQVLGSWSVFDQPGRVDNSPHGETHRYLGGDVSWVEKDRFLPLLVLPNGLFEVQIYGGPLYGAGTVLGEVANQLLDLASYQPAAGAEWVLIQAENSTGTISVVESAVVVNKGLLVRSLTPAPDVDHTPLCGIKFYDGQEKLQRNTGLGGINDFYDLRFAGYASSVGLSSFDIGAAIHAAASATPADADEFGFRKDADGLFHKTALSDLRSVLRYRQFVTSNDGSGFQFVQTADGEPVMVLLPVE